MVKLLVSLRTILLSLSSSRMSLLHRRFEKALPASWPLASAVVADAAYAFAGAHWRENMFAVARILKHVSGGSHTLPLTAS